MKEFLVFVVRQLVDRPDEVVLHDHSDAAAYRYRLEMAAPDVGKIIGRNGQTIGAIREVLAASASRQGKRVSVDITERT